MADNNVHPLNLSQAARACGGKVASAVFLVVAAGAGIGTVIENKTVLAETLKAAWTLLLWLFSFGGTFWGAVVAGGAAMSAAIWTACVVEKCPAHSKKVALVVLAVFFMMWLLAAFAVHTTFTETANLSAYQKIALLVLHGPFITSIFLGVVFIALEAGLGFFGMLPLVGFVFFMLSFIRNFFI